MKKTETCWNCNGYGTEPFTHHSDGPAWIERTCNICDGKKTITKTIQLNKNADHIISVLQGNGFQAVYAGGCVRDAILDIPSSDFDIATNATPSQVESFFKHTIPVGKAFGVIIVRVENEEFEVATFRSDGKYSDGRHPDTVMFSDMKNDALRRDLTINALFYDPIADEIYDFVGGKMDLSNRIIRMVGNPYKRLEEDMLRTLRVIRFAIRFNYRIDDETLKAVKDNAVNIHKVSAERIRQEIVKMLAENNHRKMLTLLEKTGLLKQILPEIQAMKGCEQPETFHPEGDVFEHTIVAMENLHSNSTALKLATLFHDVGKPVTQTFEDRIRFNQHESVGAELTRKIMERLKFSNKEIEEVVDLVGNHMKFMTVMLMKKSTLKKFLSMPNFKLHLELHRVDCISSHGKLTKYDFCLEKLEEFRNIADPLVVERIISGKDLIELGFKPGPLFKEILAEIENLQLENEIDTREKALEYIKKNWNAK